jgi:NTP pyrophosphatase (non-canonical NTP hydrolase)
VKSSTDVDQLRQALRQFAAERDWERFHSPKNLAMALASEAGELLEHFQWLSEAESDALSPQVKQAVSEELADVYLYLIQLADRLSIDLSTAAKQKIAVTRRSTQSNRPKATRTSTPHLVVRARSD